VNDFIKAFLVLKKVIANKWLNGNTEVIRDIDLIYSLVVHLQTILTQTFRDFPYKD